ncbi:hypothetical protein FQA47_016205 [Oryzias melastigma]|uniref:Uncharacterized protein n=1 Tax=Oryzias melastigma TaxID=30732 RepID=A0A834EZS4_ORYME|nr:hypothetical protein FQA47_016205 [Oryzias melastigma]
MYLTRELDRNEGVLKKAALNKEKEEPPLLQRLQLSVGAFIGRMRLGSSEHPPLSALHLCSRTAPMEQTFFLLE